MPLPSLTVCTEGGTLVYMNGALIAELRENRYLRFRSCPKNENWFATPRRPSDMGVEYSDKGVAGIKVLKAEYEDHLQDGGFFRIKTHSIKPMLEEENFLDFELTGIWIEEKQEFAYRLDFSMFCRTADWYRHSVYAAAYRRISPSLRPRLQVFDYRIDGISVLEALQDPSTGGVLRYDGFFSSPDGVSFEKWPKTSVPYPTRDGNYLTIRCGDRLKEGACYGFAGRKEGGWISRIEETSAPVSYEICWRAQDIHVFQYDAVPPMEETESFRMKLVLRFDPLSPAEASDLLDRAAERPWRKEEAYALPLFTAQNRFDRLLTQVPFEETGYQQLWWASSACCRPDAAVGYSDSYSVTICRNEDSPVPDAWNSYCYGESFDSHPTAFHRYRLSAMVRTENCSGHVRIGHALQKKGSDIFYGCGTHSADGKPLDSEIDWDFSESLTGTNDWTELSLEFDMTDQRPNLYFLEMNGAGQCWFDDVCLTDLGRIGIPFDPVTDDFASGSLRGWVIDAHQMPALTDDGLALERSSDGAFSADERGLLFTTEGKILQRPLTLTRILPEHEGRFDLRLVLSARTEEADLLKLDGETVFSLRNGKIMAEGTISEERLLPGQKIQICLHAENGRIELKWGEKTVSLSAAGRKKPRRLQMTFPAGGSGEITVHAFAWKNY